MGNSLNRLYVYNVQCGAKGRRTFFIAPGMCVTREFKLTVEQYNIYQSVF